MQIRGQNELAIENLSDIDSGERGLRILGRIIARELIRRKGNTNKWTTTKIDRYPVGKDNHENVS